jgi:hypothetical protein
MALENKLGMTNSADLAREEERISKKVSACRGFLFWEKQV